MGEASLVRYQALVDDAALRALQRCLRRRQNRRCGPVVLHSSNKFGDRMMFEGLDEQSTLNPEVAWSC